MNRNSDVWRGKFCYWVSFKAHSRFIESTHYETSEAKFGKNFEFNFLWKIWFGEYHFFLRGKGGCTSQKPNLQFIFSFLICFVLFFCTFQEDIVIFKSLFKQYKLIFEASDVDNRIVELLISTIQMFRICVVKHNHEARREQKRITRIEVIYIFFFSELPEGSIYWLIFL